MKISIVIPAHNEETRIPRTLESYGRFFSGLKKARKIENFEINVIVNASKDKTLDVVKAAGKKFKEIRWLDFEQGGKGFAIIEGFKDSLKRKSDLIGFVDADMSTSPEEFFKLAENIREYDGIIASRYIEGAVVEKQPFRRIAVSRLGNFIIRTLFFMPYHDTQLGAKLFRREAIASIVDELGVTNWAFDVDLLYKLRKKGKKIREIASIWKDEGGSKLNLKRATPQVFFAVFQLRIFNSPLNRIWDIIKPLAGFFWRAVK